MVHQRADGSIRIQNLNWEIAQQRTRRGRALTEEEVEEKRKERDDLLAQREKNKQAASAACKLVTKRINEHTTGEANRIIAATIAGTATLERRFDRLEANLASRSSGRDDLLQRLVGQPGSSKEIQAEIDARKEDLKRKRRGGQAGREAAEAGTAPRDPARGGRHAAGRRGAARRPGPPENARPAGRRGLPLRQAPCPRSDTNASSHRSRRTWQPSKPSGTRACAIC